MMALLRMTFLRMAFQRLCILSSPVVRTLHGVRADPRVTGRAGAWRGGDDYVFDGHFRPLPVLPRLCVRCSEAGSVVLHLRSVVICREVGVQTPRHVVENVLCRAREYVAETKVRRRRNGQVVEMRGNVRETEVVDHLVPLLVVAQADIRLAAGKSESPDGKALLELLHSLPGCNDHLVTVEEIGVDLAYFSLHVDQTYVWVVGGLMVKGG